MYNHSLHLKALTRQLATVRTRMVVPSVSISCRRAAWRLMQRTQCNKRRDRTRGLVTKQTRAQRRTWLCVPRTRQTNLGRRSSRATVRAGAGMESWRGRRTGARPCIHNKKKAEQRVRSKGGAPEKIASDGGTTGHRGANMDTNIELDDRGCVGACVALAARIRETRTNTSDPGFRVARLNCGATLLHAGLRGRTGSRNVGPQAEAERRPHSLTH